MLIKIILGIAVGVYSLGLVSWAIACVISAIVTVVRSKPEWSFVPDGPGNIS